MTRARAPKPPPPPPPTPEEIAALPLCPYAHQLCRLRLFCQWSRDDVVALLQRYLAPRQTDVPRSHAQRQESAYRQMERTLVGCPQAVPIGGPQEDPHA